MICLCCGKEIRNSDQKWHKACIKKFFNTSFVPELDFVSEYSLNELGEKFISDSKSITGVQKKLSLHFSKEDNPSRLTLIGYPYGYILKPNSSEFPFIAEAEHLVMLMANECKIKTSPHALIKFGDSYAYITKRIDRKDNEKIHMEDFCQLSLRPTEYKYNSSYERCAKIIEKYSNDVLNDKVELFYRVCFCYITGNSDMHLKNFSLIENENKVSLSPAYDLLPVKIIINDDEDFALTLNGKKKNITKNDFIKFARSIEIDEKVAVKLIKFLVGKKDVLQKLIEESFLPNEIKLKFITFLNLRISSLL